MTKEELQKILNSKNAKTQREIKTALNNWKSWCEPQERREKLEFFFLNMISWSGLMKM